MTAVEEMALSLRHPDRFYIGGEWVTPATDSTIDVITPSTEELFLRVAEAQPDDISRAVAAARLAFDEGPWPRMSHAERAELMHALADGLRERAPELAFAHTSEVGVTYTMAQMGAAGSGGTYDYYANLADTFPFIERHPGSMGSHLSLLVQEPVGVVGAIIPWNTPTSAAAMKVAPALIAGCTLVIKSSPEAPSAMLLLAEVADAVGIPPGVINVLTADREVSELLVTDPRVDKISFTGSAVAGRRIASLLGARMARFTLELGGKSAGVILDDYDIEVAAKTLAGTATRMSGQTCASLTRLVVNKNRHDDFVEALSAAISRVKVGDPFEATTQMGPLAMRRQRDRVEHYIAKGIEEGATLATGGHRPTDLPRGFYIEPTVFGGVDNHSTIAREEIFGPVLSVIAADDDDQAVRIANDSEYGLNAVVFTNDADKALAVAREFRSGTVGHNAPIYDFQTGFGGFKQSGIGREGGVQGLLPYLESKTVLLMAEPSTLGNVVSEP
jgi:aldehyde dehydrogenase (NAD+)